MEIIDSKMALSDLDRRDIGGNTALSYAVIYSNPKFIQQLLSNEIVDVDGASRGGTTPLMNAAWLRDVDIVQMLLSAGADVDKVNAKGCTALMYAAFNGKIDIMNMLLEAGADLNVVCIKEKTALDYAVMHGEKVGFAILDRNVDINLLHLNQEDVQFYCKKMPNIARHLSNKSHLFNERNQIAWKKFRLSSLYI